MSDLARLQEIRDRIANGLPPADVIEDTRYLLGVIHSLANDVSANEDILFDDPQLSDWEGEDFADLIQFYRDIKAASDLPPRRKRCEKCAGDGDVSLVTGHAIYSHVCDACHGTGYQTASEETSE